MNLNAVDPRLACWRIVHSYADFYPPEETAKDCAPDKDSQLLETLDTEYNEVLAAERKSHQMKCDVFESIINHLYDSGIPVQNLATEYIESAETSDSDALTIRFDELPENLLQDLPTEDHAQDYETALESTIKFCKNGLEDVETSEERVAWFDALHMLTDAPVEQLNELLLGPSDNGS